MKDVLRVLQGLLGQVPLPLDLDVQAGGDVRHQDVDQLTDSEDHVLEYDDERELQGEDLPVDWSEEAELVSESSVVTFRLEIHFTITSNIQTRNCGEKKVLGPLRPFIIAA